MNEDWSPFPIAIPGVDAWHLGPDVAGDHHCYFCKPAAFPPMPERCTLCARCGVFMYTGVDDPMNDEMAVCKPCDKEMSTR